MDNKKLLLQYTGFAMQTIIVLGFSAGIGVSVDSHWFNAIPLMVWLLPLVVLIALLVKLLKDTSK